jgi:fructosamine-3-kinase
MVLSRNEAFEPWREELEARVAGYVRSVARVAGGDIASSHRVEFEGGESIFVKDYGPALPGIAEAEARGLAWLAEARALRVPEVLANGDGWLALEWIDSARPVEDFHERLGRGLAELHAKGAARYGFGRDNWIGRLPQRNAEHSDWAGFYAECRLRPLRQRAAQDGILPESLARRLDALIEGLPARVGSDEQVARLHGDLWSGNLMVDERGEPCLIDPAVYAGNREIDLAMMRLFGGFDRRAFQAYGEAAPLSPGALERIPLYQVYPLLVHVCLFGRSYLDRLSRAIEAALAIGV